MQIIKGENVKADTLLFLIYGEVGIGKTSLALTSKNPIIIDTEKGLRRSEFRAGVDTIQVDLIDELLEPGTNYNELFSQYDTIIIDTVDALLEKTREYIERLDFSLKRNTLKMYGQLKDQFNLLLTRLMQTKKDIILIAHSSTEEINGINRTTPKITGGSKELIKQRTDFIGYLYSKNNERVLTFKPSDYWDAKNSANFGEIIIQNFNKAGMDTMQKIIDDAKKHINKINEGKLHNNLTMQFFTKKINKIDNLDELNNLISVLQNEDVSKNTKNLIFRKIKDRAILLEPNAIFNKDTMLFEITTEEIENG